MEVYAANDCFVLSDEIWSDLILPELSAHPPRFPSRTMHAATAAFYAPSKTFSLAGLIGSYHIIPDPWLRDRVTRQGDLSHYNSCNVLSLHALLGAYSDEGAQWLDELRPRAGGQHPLCLRFHRRSLPGVQVMQPQGDLYAVSGLRRMAAGAPYDAAGAGGARRACRCHLAGRRGVCVAGLHPDESGPAAQPARRGHGAPSCPCLLLKCWRASSARMVCSSMRSSRRPPVQSRACPAAGRPRQRQDDRTRDAAGLSRAVLATSARRRSSP